MTAMRAILLACLLVCGCDHDWSKDKHPSRRSEKVVTTYTVGVVSMGATQYQMRADSTKYLVQDTIHVYSVRFHKEQPTVRNRMGVPAHWEVRDKDGKYLFSDEDIKLKRLQPMKPGHIYRVDYGYRDAWHAASHIWNIFLVRELVPTQKG